MCAVGGGVILLFSYAFIKEGHTARLGAPFIKSVVLTTLLRHGHVGLELLESYDDLAVRIPGFTNGWYTLTKQSRSMKQVSSSTFLGHRISNKKTRIESLLFIRVLFFIVS